MDGTGSYFAHINLATVATGGVGEDVGSSVGFFAGADVTALGVKGFEGTAICGFVFRAKVGDEVLGRGVGEDVD